MPTPVTIGLWDEVREQALDRLRDLASETVHAQLGPDGESYGDQDPGRAMRIAAFLEDAQSGALEILKVQSPDIYRRYVAQYERDIKESPLIGGA